MHALDGGFCSYGSHCGAFCSGLSSLISWSPDTVGTCISLIMHFLLINFYLLLYFASGDHRYKSMTTFP